MSKLDRLRWLYLNWRHNMRGDADLDPAMGVRRFRTAGLDGLWSRIRADASPARRLSDMFWLSLPWDRITSALGGKVRILEVGCGTGRYGVLLQEILGDAFAGYAGVDVEPHPDWQSLSDKGAFRFHKASSDQTTEFIGDANFIITQSAIEHFEHDLRFFRQVAAHVAGSRSAMIQVHLMPSAGCLGTYLWHGVRQYTPRTLSTITRLFGAETRRQVFFLGGSECNRVHRRFITYPWLLNGPDPRQLQPESYEQQLRAAIAKDDDAPARGDACIHGLVLQSKLGEDVFAS